ncbi:MAG: hypothetical protein ABI548_22235, partial [Polyangiaceae bacterium]
MWTTYGALAADGPIADRLPCPACHADYGAPTAKIYVDGEFARKSAKYPRFDQPTRSAPSVI